MGRLLSVIFSAAAVLMPSVSVAANDCAPSCGSGTFCYQGQCRSACNPQCAPGLQCLDSGECVEPIKPPPVETPRAQPVPTKPPSLNSSGEAAAPGFHWEKRRRTSLLIPGVTLFLIGYVGAGLYGGLGYAIAADSKSGFGYDNRNAYLFSLIPLAGPALSQVILRGAQGYQAGGAQGLETAFIGLVTALQLTGVALGVLSFVFKQEVEIQDERAAAGSPRLRWSLAPTAPGAPLGVSLVFEN